LHTFFYQEKIENKPSSFIFRLKLLKIRQIHFYEHS